MAMTKAMTNNPNHPALLNAPTLCIQTLQSTPILNCHWPCRLGLTLHWCIPMASFVLFSFGSSTHTFAPWHQLVHTMVMWHATHGVQRSGWKEWWQPHEVGIVPFIFLCSLYSTIVFRNTFIVHVTLFPKCACQSCINIAPCPLVHSLVSLS